MTALLRFNGAVSRDPAVDSWLETRPEPLGELAREWYSRIRALGPDVRELLHDGCPTACIDGAGLAYVNVFTHHVNVGFFLGAELPDPSGILEGSGQRMRHVKLRFGTRSNTRALEALLRAAYDDLSARVAAERDAAPSLTPRPTT